MYWSILNNLTVFLTGSIIPFAFGGIPVMPPNPSESTGLQFLQTTKGGFLGSNFKSKGGLPVINIPGCPAHPAWLSQILVAIATGRLKDVLLDEYNRPKTMFTDFTQTGCTNAVNFGQKYDGGFGKRGGCLFYRVGCRGPMTRSSCNRVLWNRVASKTRVGHPCLGCTEPGFPHHNFLKGSVFKTRDYLGFIPRQAPTGETTFGYFIKAGIDKVWPTNKAVTETSK